MKKLSISFQANSQTKGEQGSGELQWLYSKQFILWETKIQKKKKKTHSTSYTKFTSNKTYQSSMT